VILNKNSKIWEYVIIRAKKGKLILGENSRLGPFTVVFTGEHGVFIGKDVMIAPHCVLAAGNHNFKQIGKPIIHSGSFSKGPIIIEDDVWIGANSIITDGIKIEKGAVIGAGSVVTKNVESFTIVGGNPAVFIGNRVEKYS
jgi:acetyltransferase-like isoleucine patch superfamily enzyme